MENLFIYLLKSASLLALFWLGYVLLLKQETFFKSNRWYLLGGYATALLLPLVTLKKVIFIDPAPQLLQLQSIPVAGTSAVEDTEINWWATMALIYAIGTAVLLLFFIRDWFALRMALRGRTVSSEQNYKLVDVAEPVSPFSYFSYIVYNSALYSPEELQNIISHEKVHSAQYHSADVLITRMFCIAFWFNPFVWLYKKAVLQNLEFIADREATRNMTDKKHYQKTLLKVTAHENRLEISNHFFQSLIKKRIVMLNKNQSSRWNSWKYATIIPMLSAFVLGFQVETVAQVSPDAPPAPTAQQPEVQLTIDKNTTDEQLKREAAQMKDQHGVQVKFSKVKRNNNGEITAIKAEIKDNNGRKTTTQVSSDEPIKPISIHRSPQGTFAFGSPEPHFRVTRNGKVVAGTNFHVESDDIIAMEAPPRAPLPPNQPQMPPHPQMPQVPGPGTVHYTDDEAPVVIVDGKVLSTGKSFSDLDPKTISSIKVIKGEGAKVYGTAGENGVIIIDTKQINKIVDDALTQASEELSKSGPELERAMVELEREKARIRSNNSEAERKEMEQAKKEIEAARKEIKKAKAEIEKTKAEIKKARAELNK